MLFTHSTHGQNFLLSISSACGVNCQDTHSEPDNLRCWIKGFRDAKPESGLYKRGMSEFSLEQFAKDMLVVLRPAFVHPRIRQLQNGALR